MARLCLDQTSLSLCHRRHVAALCMLYKVNSNSNHCSVSLDLLLSEFDILELRLLLIHESLNYQGVEHPNLQGVFCQPRLVCGMTFHTFCLTPERYVGLTEQSSFGAFLSLFFSFSVEQVSVRLRKQFTNTWACAAGFNNNNNNNNNDNYNNSN